MRQGDNSSYQGPAAVPAANTSAEFIPVASPVIGEREISYVTDAIKSGWVSSMGPYCQRFERDYAQFVGAKHAISLANGTVALHLALHTLGVGPGDEVILPDLTFAATAHSVLQVGATPVLVDVEQDTWCLDPRALERAITKRTRAVMPVHLFGHPADMTAINEIVSGRNIFVIEDAAEAHGAEVNGRRVGSLGTVAAFSFYGNKVMTTGEGGMLTTDDDRLAERLRFLKDHGMSKERRYYHTELAFNYRLTNLQAALGVAQLEQIDDFIGRKRQIMEWYREMLEGVPGITLNTERSGYFNVYWMISVVLGAEVKQSRDQVCRRLREAGIDTRPFFVAMSELPHLSQLKTVGASAVGCPVSLNLSNRGFSLPSGCGLERSHVERACGALIDVLR